MERINTLVFDGCQSDMEDQQVRLAETAESSDIRGVGQDGGSSLLAGVPRPSPTRG
jgi:hypothetical protein